MPIIVNRRNVPPDEETVVQGEKMPSEETVVETTMPHQVIVNVPSAQSEEPSPTAADIQALLDAERERVRKEEKDKLYPQIDELKNQIKTLAEEREARLAAEQTIEQQRAEEERLAREAEMTALQRLEEYKSEQESRFADLIAERDRERALREREAEYARVAEYRARRMAEESNEIAPQLLDYISGSSEEEIEHSIQTAKAKTAQILEEVAQAQLGQRRQTSPPVSGIPPVDMLGGQEQQRSLSAEDIRNMDMSEYQQYRSQLLGAASDRARNQGPYAP
jgi:hypothetical protein